MHRVAHRLIGVTLALTIALPGDASAGQLGGIRSSSLFATTARAVPDVPTIVMADAFTTPGKVDKRVPEVRGTSQWIEIDDPWKTEGGQLVPPKPGRGGRPNAVVYPTGLNDVTVEVNLTLAPAGTRDNIGGIVVRSNANSKTRQLEVDLTRGTGSGGTAVVRARRDTDVTTLASFSVANLATTVRLRVSAVGNTISVSLGSTVIGVVALTGANSTDFATFRNHGLTSTSDAIRFDDVLITDTL